jgi:hypothetical protein
MIFLLLACAPDACDALCDAGLTRFQGCLDEAGLEWGASVGYEDPADYEGWCATYTWELRQLGQADSCADRTSALEAATCADYGQVWEVEE